PVLLAVATATALVLAFLYLARPSPAELGAFRVIVSDDAGRAANTIHVTVAEAPYQQKETVSPGVAYTGIVRYPTPYLTQPHLKLTFGRRQYVVVAETEFGFTWAAQALPDDFREDTRKDAKLLDKLLGGSLL